MSSSQHASSTLSSQPSSLLAIEMYGRIVSLYILDLGVSSRALRTTSNKTARADSIDFDLTHIHDRLLFRRFTTPWFIGLLFSTRPVKDSIDHCNSPLMPSDEQQIQAGGDGVTGERAQASEGFDTTSFAQTDENLDWNELVNAFDGNAGLRTFDATTCAEPLSAR